MLYKLSSSYALFLQFCLLYRRQQQQQIYMTSEVAEQSQRATLSMVKLGVKVYFRFSL